VREINGAELPVHIESIALGEDTAQPWDQRLMPLTILIAVFFGGMMLPAASLIHEKNKHTLEALNVTPVSLTEIFSSKGLAGIVLAISMGILTMAISRAFNENWLYMLITLALGAVMAALLGLLAGALIKDLNTSLLSGNSGDCCCLVRPLSSCSPRYRNG
jgi:ABC-2 type transport system permease protein